MVFEPNKDYVVLLSRKVVHRGVVYPAVRQVGRKPTRVQYTMRGWLCAELADYISDVIQ